MRVDRASAMLKIIKNSTCEHSVVALFRFRIDLASPKSGSVSPNVSKPSVAESVGVVSDVLCRSFS